MIWVEAQGQGVEVRAGYGNLNNSAGAVLRGGNWNNNTNSGVFTANLNNGPLNSNTNIGFRCVFGRSETWGRRNFVKEVQG